MFYVVECMKIFKRNLIIALQSAALLISLCLIIYRGFEKDWATVAASLAVVAALIANLNGQRVAWRQEDEFEPDVEVQYDLKSRNSIVLLSLRNTGGSNAYDVSLIFDVPLIDHTGQVVSFEQIPCVIRGERLKKIVDVTVDFFRKIEIGQLNKVQSGIVQFKTSKLGKRYIRKRFYISIEQYRRSPRAETDKDGFYQKNVDINNTLKAVDKTLQNLVKTISYRK